jgi:peptide/nickel transport system substrate-binding protein
MYVTVAGAFDADSPITNAYLSASCGSALPGWPCDKTLDDLRNAWLKETNAAKRKELLDQFHARAFEALPYINVGQYSAAFATRKEVKGAEKMWGGLPLVWHLDK